MASSAFPPLDESRTYNWRKRDLDVRAEPRAVPPQQRAVKWNDEDYAAARRRVVTHHHFLYESVDDIMVVVFYEWVAYIFPWHRRHTHTHTHTRRVYKLVRAVFMSLVWLFSRFHEKLGPFVCFVYAAPCVFYFILFWIRARAWICVWMRATSNEIVAKWKVLNLRAMHAQHIYIPLYLIKCALSNIILNFLYGLFFWVGLMCASARVM